MAQKRTGARQQSLCTVALILHTLNWTKNARFQIIVPQLPGKAFKRQLPFRSDDGIFEEGFIEDRRKGLEQFLNKFVYLCTRAILFIKHYFCLQGCWPSTRAKREISSHLSTKQ